MKNLKSRVAIRAVGTIDKNCDNPSRGFPLTSVHFKDIRKAISCHIPMITKGKFITKNTSQNPIMFFDFIILNRFSENYLWICKFRFKKRITG